MAIFTQPADSEQAENANANDNDDTAPKQQQQRASGDNVHWEKYILGLTCN